MPMAMTSCEIESRLPPIATDERDAELLAEMALDEDEEDSEDEEDEEDEVELVELLD